MKSRKNRGSARLRGPAGIPLCPEALQVRLLSSLPAALFLVFLFVVSNFLPLPGAALPGYGAEKLVVSVITGITGGVSVEREGKALTGKLRMALYPGDLLKTGPGQRVEVLFWDGTELKVNERSQVKFQERSPKKKGIFLLLGEVFARVVPQGKQAWKINAGSAVAAIEGTECHLKVDHFGRSVLTVLTGKVRFFLPELLAASKTPSGLGQLATPVICYEGYQSTASRRSLTAPSAVKDLGLIVAWTKKIAEYGVMLERFQSLYDQIEAEAQARSGAIPEDLADQMNDLLREFGAIVLDEEFRVSHMKLRSALDYFKQSLIFTDPQDKERFIALAHSSLAEFKAAFPRFITTFRTEVRQTLSQ